MSFAHCSRSGFLGLLMASSDRLQSPQTIEPSSKANAGTPSSKASTPVLELNDTTAWAFAMSFWSEPLEFLQPLGAAMLAIGCALKTTGRLATDCNTLEVCSSQ